MPRRRPALAPASVHERTAQFLMPVRRRLLGITTPEGVRLQVELADPGERISAFLLDVVFITVIQIVLILVTLAVAGVGVHARLAVALMGLIVFLVRSLYFVRFELAWRGVTPGKRIIGLRVIDRAGGPLLPSAVITRNITREVETFMPLTALLTARLVGGWDTMATLLWLIVLAGVPYFTRNRTRVGDLLAGTVVVTVPKRVLAPDLIGAPAMFAFTDQQLRAYGAFEVQVLEEVLRRPDTAETAALVADICTRICQRIDWPGTVPADQSRRFLTAFYAAQRAHLEREQLFGRARETKMNA
jgi:uncharacterized RDD family membrane protein YckC